MPHTVIAYSESQDSATLIEIAALADQSQSVSGDDIFVPGATPYLAGWWFGGTNFTQGQIGCPTLRGELLIDVEPGDVADEPASPPAFHDRFANPIKLVKDEGLRTYMAEDAAAASRVTAILWLSTGKLEHIEGRILTVRTTNTTALAANAWTAGALTFAQTLPAGRYAIVGMRAQSAGLRAARLIFPGGGLRPGCLGCDADGDIDGECFRYGKIGNWGEFDHRSPPQAEFLSASADASQVVHLDLIKIA